MDLPDLSSAAPLLTPIWNAVVDTWLKPALAKMKQQKRLDVSFDEHGFANAFSDYLERSYNKHLFITTVVFQNQQKALFDLYVPLTLVNREDELSYIIDTYSSSFVPNYKNVLVLDHGR